MELDLNKLTSFMMNFKLKSTEIEPLLKLLVRFNPNLFDELENVSALDAHWQVSIQLERIGSKLTDEEDNDGLAFGLY